MQRCTCAALALTLLLSGCDQPIFADCDGGECMDASADAGDAARPDASDTQSDAGDAGMDASVCEEREESTDYADCIGGACPFDDVTLGQMVLSAGDTESRVGRIDDRTHTLAGPGCGGITDAQDIDWLQVEAPARSIIEVELSPQCPSAPLQPWLGLHDSLRIVHLTAAEPGETARLVYVQPYRALPAYLLVEAFGNRDRACREPVGGSGYGYALTARVTDRRAVELGSLGATPLTYDGANAQRGDLEFFRVVGRPGERARVHVELIDGSCPTELYDEERRLQRCVLHLLRLDPFDGNSRPVSCDFDEADIWGSPPRDDAAFVEERVVDIAPSGEILFAVTDWNALGAAGYRYRVTVSLDPGAVADGCTVL